jgi:hypothetical protein
MDQALDYYGITCMPIVMYLAVAVVANWTTLVVVDYGIGGDTRDSGLGTVVAVGGSHADPIG